jgi:hypothetical protein
MLRCRKAGRVAPPLPSTSACQTVTNSGRLHRWRPFFLRVAAIDRCSGRCRPFSGLTITWNAGLTRSSQSLDAFRVAVTHQKLASRWSGMHCRAFGPSLSRPRHGQNSTSVEVFMVTTSASGHQPLSGRWQPIRHATGRNLDVAARRFCDARWRRCNRCKNSRATSFR